MSKNKTRKRVTWLLTMLLFGLVLFGIMYLIAFLASGIFQGTTKAIFAGEGLVLALVGVLLSPGGNSGINLRGFGERSGNSIAYQDLETSRILQQQEREDTEYYKNYLSGSVKEVCKNNLVYVITGVAAFLFSIQFL